MFEEDDNIMLEQEEFVDDLDDNQDDDIVEKTERGVDSLLFTVYVQAASLNLTLGQLQQMEVGDLLTIGELPPHVKLVTGNNQHLGDGVLVDVDGRLGVKLITKVNSY